MLLPVYVVRIEKTDYFIRAMSVGAAVIARSSVGLTSMRTGASTARPFHR
jgi:hypothetical protein